MVDPQYVELLNLVESVDARIPWIHGRSGGGAKGRVSAHSRRAATRGVRRGHRPPGPAEIGGAGAGCRGARTVGFPRAHLREPAARVLYTDAPDPGPAVHVVHKNLALLEAVGVSDRRARFPVNIPRTAGRPVGDGAVCGRRLCPDQPRRRVAEQALAARAVRRGRRRASERSRPAVGRAVGARRGALAAEVVAMPRLARRSWRRRPRSSTSWGSRVRRG